MKEHERYLRQIRFRDTLAYEEERDRWELLANAVAGILVTAMVALIADWAPDLLGLLLYLVAVIFAVWVIRLVAAVVRPLPAPVTILAMALTITLLALAVLGPILFASDWPRLQR